MISRLLNKPVGELFLLGCGTRLRSNSPRQRKKPSQLGIFARPFEQKQIAGRGGFGADRLLGQAKASPAALVSREFNYDQP